jgi:hypothetical protein
MHPLIQLRQTTSVFLVAFGLTCFWPSPAVQAVTPAPDGGYPGNNTAEGTNALFNLTTGTNNTATGYRALRNNTGGNFNTATGAEALLSTTTGIRNTANGTFALFSNTTGGGILAGNRQSVMRHSLVIPLAAVTLRSAMPHLLTTSGVRIARSMPTRLPVPKPS